MTDASAGVDSGGNKKIKVQLTIHANRLKNVAGLGKGMSDPYAIVTVLASDAGEKPCVLGKTEIIKNTLNPQWTTPFTLDFEFGKTTHINVGVYDAVQKSDDKAMGSAAFEIGDILGAKGNIKAKKLKQGGVLFARVVKTPDEPIGELTFALRGMKLKNVEGFFRGKSDPFFELCRRIDGPGGTTWRPVYRSPHVDNDFDPSWPQASIGLDLLCDGDLERPIQIAVYNYEPNGWHKSMGIIETSVGMMIAAETRDGSDMSKAFELKHKGKTFGLITVAVARLSGDGVSSDGPRVAGESTVANVPNTDAVSPPENDRPIAAAAAAVVSTENSAVTPSGDSLNTRALLSGGAPSARVSPPGGTPPLLVPPFSGVPPAHVPLSASAPPSDGSSFNIAPPSYVHPYSSAPPLHAPSNGSDLPTNNMFSASAPIAPPHAYQGLASKRRPNFVDYVSGGCELQMCFAIDFTGSNGDPRMRGTLHHMYRDGRLNDYEKAIKAVGSIVAKYDSDKKFPVWGFGAKYGGIVRHCFQCGPTVEADGIDGVLEAYRGVFRTGLIMSGPTVFTEVIHLAASQAQRSQENAKKWGTQSYTILLILTDGAVSDVEATRRAILDVSDAPLSIVIVGVGQADFSAMQFLDDLNVGPNGKDIVQFVPFNAHRHSKTSLTRATLEEIPDQLVNYFTSRNIMPLPMPSGSRFDIFEEEHNSETDVDLSVGINPDGEITLNGGGYLEDSWYGSKYAGLSILPPPTSTHNGGGTIGGIPDAPQPPHQSVRRLRVQVPHGVYSGMQLQVQNIETMQMMLVTVPPGLGPGSVFDVAY